VNEGEFRLGEKTSSEGDHNHNNDEGEVSQGKGGFLYKHPQLGQIGGNAHVLDNDSKPREQIHYDIAVQAEFKATPFKPSVKAVPVHRQ